MRSPRQPERPGPEIQERGQLRAQGIAVLPCVRECCAGVLQLRQRFVQIPVNLPDLYFPRLQVLISSLQRSAGRGQGFFQSPPLTQHLGRLNSRQLNPVAIGLAWRQGAIRIASIAQGCKEGFEPLEECIGLRRREQLLPQIGLALPEVCLMLGRPPQTGNGRFFSRLLGGVHGRLLKIIHQPAAHTDGDSLVYFRYSDVIAAGDIFVTTSYPIIDLQRGGNVQGIIDGLNRILDMSIAEYRTEGGTMIVPGHGRLCDSADVAYYRDMVTIIRDRVDDMIKKGMTLEQIKAARPTRDYDPRYGATSGFWTTDMFVEAVYKSLKK